MDRLFENTYVRRLFFIAFGTILVAYALLRYLIAGTPGAGTVLELADKFAMSLLVTVLLGAFLFYVTPRILRSRQLELVPPRDLRALFRSEIEVSRTWTFRGATGRFVRSQVLPRFLERATQQRQVLSVTLILLDVSNEQASREYAAYRRGIEHGSNEWSPDRVREEVCATVIAALASRTSFLQIQVALATTFSCFRADISDDKVILTKEDPSSSALVCNREDQYYDYFVLDTHLARGQGRQLQAPTALVDLNNITTEQLRDALRDLGLLKNGDTEEFLGMVLRIAKERRNPYPG